MLDGVVTFDLERYAHMPDRLARIVGDLEEAAELLLGSGDPAGAGAAALLDRLAGWVRLQQARAADRWEQIMAIPGFGRFEAWRWGGGDGSFVWDVGWVTATDGEMHSYDELVALATYEVALRPILGRAEGGDPPEQDDVDAALAAIAAIERPAAASALLDALGADGFRQLHSALAATTDQTDADDVARLEGGIGTLTAIFASATRAVGRERLSDAFVDDFLGPAPDGGGETGGEAVGAVAGNPVDAAQQAFVALDFGRDVAERLASLAGPRGALVVLERAGAPFAILTAGMPLVDLLQHGIGPEVAESSITSGLGLAAFLAESAAVSVVCFSAAVLVSLIFASADDDVTPPGLVLSPDASNPGGAHYPFAVNEAGVPAPPNGV